MSLLVLALLARPGGGSGGAEAPPLRVRAHGAALERACCRRHGTTPGAGRRVRQTFGEDREHLLTEHLHADPLSCGDLRGRGSCDPAEAAVRGAHTPRSPATAVAWQASFSSTSSATFTKLFSLLCFGRGAWLVRCARPRVMQPAAVASSTPDPAAHMRHGSRPSICAMGGLRGERQRLFVIKSGARSETPNIDVPNAFLALCRNQTQPSGGHTIPAVVVPP